MIPPIFIPFCGPQAYCDSGGNASSVLDRLVKTPCPKEHMCDRRVAGQKCFDLSLRTSVLRAVVFPPLHQRRIWTPPVIGKICSKNVRARLARFASAEQLPAVTSRGRHL